LNNLFGYWQIVESKYVHTKDSIEKVDSICGQILYKVYLGNKKDYDYILLNYRYYELCESLASVLVGLIGADDELQMKKYNSETF